MKYTVYLRVSTQKQNVSGLGLEAQRKMIDNFLKDEDEVISEHVEIETGKNPDRVKLQAAIETAKKHNAKLLIAKIDRLARSVYFVSKLMDSGVEFIAVDLPQANRFTIHLMAALAEQEALMISQRTKAALAALKQRGVKLGKNNLTDEAREKGRIVKQQLAFENEQNKKAGLVITSLRKVGMSYLRIAQHLNDNGYKTRTGKQFASATVQNLYHRYIDYFKI